MKKWFLLVLFLTLSFSWLSYAVNIFNYESAKSLASDYIINSSFDENWKNNNPQINWDAKYFYTDSENPSYIEFKVSCDNNKDCWFVLVNFDWDDVSVPIASTSWNTPSEILLAQNWWNTDDNKLYYFSPFEQYSENEKTWDISSIEQNDIIENKAITQDNNFSKDIKTKKLKEFKSKLKDRLSKAKNEAKDYKKSDDFKAKKKELKEKKQTIPKEEFSFKILPLANATTISWTTLTWYVAPTASNIFVSWNEYWTTCKWKLPCYNQFDSTYNWSNCKVWCVPTAYWIIYWYYDRNWTYPDLVTWTASTLNDTISNTMIRKLWDYLLTTCSWSAWWTNSSNLTKWIQYARDKWYANSYAMYYWTANNVSQLFNVIKTEVNGNRPIMANTSWHAMVAFWYNSTSWNPIIRLNLWWGWISQIIWTNWLPYNYSEIDYNMNWLYFKWVDNKAITSLVKINISK